MFRKWVGDFTALFYPENCLACSDSLAGNEKVLCTSCRLGLPLTGFHNVPDNPVEKLFWGRIPVAHATAFLFFEKTTKYRSLIHQLKYNGRKEAGIFLGNLMGSVLRHSRFEEADVMTSVPLHKAKFRRRGYNQSDIIARGITEFTKKPFIPDILKRKVHTKSQTNRGRYDRWKNAEGIFECSDPDPIKNKHVLLVDDIVTTGATLEAAGDEILKAGGSSLSFATIAFVS